MSSKPKLSVVKVGGNVIDNPQVLEPFLKDFATIDGKKILIHGGGKIATELAHNLGVETQMVDGRRITDQESLKIVTMVYGGLINKNIVTKLQSIQCNAIGLTGVDSNMIQSAKRPLKNGIDYGYVGDIQNINTAFINTLLNSGLALVVAPLSHDMRGSMLNINADTVASAIAVALSSIYTVQLYYCFELKGVLRDFDDKESVINEMNPSYYQSLKSEGIISKGMIPKIDNSFDAIYGGVKEVIICNAEELQQISHGANKGTRLFL
jgi:acetylglutamate kinase